MRDWTDTSFIDIAVRDGVREPMLAGKAVLIADCQTGEVRFANAPAAAVFELDTIGVQPVSQGPGSVATRQLRGVLSSLGETPRTSLVRIEEGLSSRLVVATVSPIMLPFMHNGGRHGVVTLDVSITDPLATAIDGLEDEAVGAAIIDADGQILTSGAQFGRIGIDGATLARLAEEVTGESDRLVKRTVETANGTAAVGVGRLSDEPGRHLVLAVLMDEETPAADEPLPADAVAGILTAEITEADATSVTFAEDLASYVVGDHAQDTADFEVAAASENYAEIEPVIVHHSEPEDAVASSDLDVIPDMQGEDEPPVLEETEHGIEPVRSDEADDNGHDDDDDDTAELIAAGVMTAPEAEEAFAGLDTTSGPIRFVWKTNRDGVFVDVSPEFARAVGPNAADITGRTFADVARVFDLDGDGAIADALRRRDTWSGKSVLWPVQGTDLRVPVDLAALPYYNRERDFEGYRGFGIARTADAVVDPSEIGLALSGPARKPAELDTPPQEPQPAVSAPEEMMAHDATDTAEENDTSAPSSDVTDHINAGETDLVAEMPRLDEPPVLVSSRITPLRRESDTVIAFTRRDMQRPSLSQTEAAAFARIGDKLGAEVGPAQPANDDTDMDVPDADPVVPTGILQPDERDGEQIEPPAPDAAADETSPLFLNAADEAEVEATGNDEDTSDDEEDDETESDIDSDGDGWLDEVDDIDSQESDDDSSEDEDDNHSRLSEPVADAESAALLETDIAPREASGELIDLPSGDDGADDGAAEPVRHVLVPSALDALPLPILIVRGENPVYANAAFHAMSGDADLEALSARGIDDLFDGPALGAGDTEAGDSDNARLVTLTDAFGETLIARVHLQRVPFADGNALMFAFEPRPARDDEAEMMHAQQAPVSMASPLNDEQHLVEEADARVAELAAILDTATDGVIVLAEDGTVRSLNGSASALFGYRSDEIVGKSFSYLFAHESQRAAMDYLHGLSNNGVASVLNEGREVLGRERQGGFIPLFMTLGRLPASKGFCAVLRDITAWKQTEQALLEARRQAEVASNTKSEFLAKISHEIRTPLNAIIGFSELMTEERFGPVGNQRYREYLTDINKSGRHVLDLVNDLLDISKIEAGKQELDFESVPLNDTIAEAIAMVQPQANRDQIIVRSNLETNVPPVVADLRSIKQIVLNLLSNAIRFTHPGGQVIVSTSYQANGSVLMRVRDTGIGMTDKELQSALQPFQQVASATMRRNDGTGLGLPLTKALVEANRAEFAIQSEPGEGTRVDITFPPARVLAS